MSYKDKDAQREYQRVWAQQKRNKKEAHKDKIRAFLAEYKSTRPCMDCGLSYPSYVMDFDHRPGEAKTKAVSQMWYNSLATIKAEIDKCDLVCANCHRERTFSRLVARSNGEMLLS